MIIFILVVLGLSMGSFVNALVWRLHEQAKSQKPKAKSQFSILKGRSMCPNCRHELAVTDLVPVLSWLWLRGKCRYCGRPISAQYPLVELSTALLFVLSYMYWPSLIFNLQSLVLFIFWLLFLVGFMALMVYDLRWRLLPNRLVYPLLGLTIVQALLQSAWSSQPLHYLLLSAVAALLGGGLFWTLFQLSKGQWIGGGDVKLGFLLGLIVATPARSLLVLFLASLLGTLVSLPLMATQRLHRRSLIPFGPFLIMAAIIVQLFGTSMLEWYQRLILIK